MSIPSSGERKPVVVLTSSAVCVLCFTVRFLFLCSSILVSLFSLALFFNSFLLYFPLCYFLSHLLFLAFPLLSCFFLLPYTLPLYFS
ncbi:hypothetical protein NC652_033947 [Populus alba x Populus x berolinensis]|nr:hypothetical protein NC652_033947 [Populus alba x Populus x berolinensis]